MKRIKLTECMNTRENNFINAACIIVYADIYVFRDFAFVEISVHHIF